MNIKFEVVKYLETDVIATSCISAGMSAKSYYFSGSASCGGWCLDLGDGSALDSCGNYDFKYYDENGSLITKNAAEIDNWGLNEFYFHYKEDSSSPRGYVFEICNKSDHEYTY